MNLIPRKLLNVRRLLLASLVIFLFVVDLLICYKVHAQECIDEPGIVYIHPKKGEKTCEWVGARNLRWRCNRDNVQNKCKLTCGTCECLDSVTFIGQLNGKHFSCKKISRKSDQNKKFLCGNIVGAIDYCQATCKDECQAPTLVTTVINVIGLSSLEIPTDASELALLKSNLMTAYANFTPEGGTVIDVTLEFINNSRKESSSSTNEDVAQSKITTALEEACASPSDCSAALSNSEMHVSESAALREEAADVNSSRNLGEVMDNVTGGTVFEVSGRSSGTSTAEIVYPTAPPPPSISPSHAPQECTISPGRSGPFVFLEPYIPLTDWGFTFTSNFTYFFDPYVDGAFIMGYGNVGNIGLSWKPVIMTNVNLNADSKIEFSFGYIRYWPEGDPCSDTELYLRIRLVAGNEDTTGSIASSGVIGPAFSPRKQYYSAVFTMADDLVSKAENGYTYLIDVVALGNEGDTICTGTSYGWVYNVTANFACYENERQSYPSPAPSVSSAPTTPKSWIQLGSDIDGEAALDQSGTSVSMSSDGGRVAIGAIFNDGNGDGTGSVRVYDYNGTAWTQVGYDIDGEGAGDWSGWSVSLSSDGGRVAIGALSNDGNGTDSGSVRVYDFNGTYWTQLGLDIDGEAAGDRSGGSVSLSSDGGRVAIGARYNGNTRGQVRVYEYDSSSWIKLGQDIDGEVASSVFGQSVTMSSDGGRVAAGTIYKNGFGGDVGSVRVYDYNGTTWTKVGSDIDGEEAGGLFGWSISLSGDGERVAIGAPRSDGSGTSDSGSVRIYDYNGTAWTQVGSDIDAEAVGDEFGDSVSLSSDGGRVAIGARYNDGNGTDSGSVRIYKYNGTSWTQLGSDIDGEAIGDESGSSVSLSADGGRVAIGAPRNYGNGTWSGQVRVYSFE